jgi:hypothetical protein
MANAALYCRPMISWSLERELADIHLHIDRLQARGQKPNRQEIDALRGRLREIERHLGINRTIAA